LKMSLGSACSIARAGACRHSPPSSQRLLNDCYRAKPTAIQGRPLAIADFPGSRRTCLSHEAARGNKPLFTCLVRRTFMRRLRPATSRPIVKDERSFIGRSGHRRRIASYARRMTALE
jgi:hypothetical protein